VTLLTTATIGAAPTALRGPGAPARSPQDLVLLAITWASLLFSIGIPLVFVVIGAVAENPVRPERGLTLDALGRVFLDGGQLLKLVQSILFALTVGVLSTAIAAAFAWTTVRLQIAGSRFRELLILAPLFVPGFIAAVTWVWLATPETGLINRWLTSLGAPEWMQLNSLSLGWMVFILVTNHVPYAYLFISASARRLDSRMEEASLMCGRGSLFTTLRISMPLLRASLLSSTLFIAIMTLGEFSVPQILGQQGAFQPLAVSVYRSLYGENRDFGYAAAVGVELMIVSLIGLHLYTRAVRRSEQFVSVSGKGLQHTVHTPARRTSVFVWVATLVYGAVAFVIPFAAMIIMALSPFVPPSLADIQLSPSYMVDAILTSEVLKATVNTLVLAVTVPAVCIALALAIVYMSDRVRLKTSGAMSYLATAPLAVPGLVMGTGLLFFLIRTPLYGNLGIIGVGLVAVGLTHALRLVSNGLKQIDPSLEEASRMSGVSGIGTVWRIVVPLLRPAVFSAFVLVFVMSMRELSVPVVLYSPGTQVLSVVGWNYSVGAFNKACAIALFQLLLMGLSVPILRWIFRLKKGE